MKWHQVFCGGRSRVRPAVFTLRALDQVSHPPMQHKAGVIGDANLLKLLNGGACADGGQGGIVGGQGVGSGCNGKRGGGGTYHAKECEDLHVYRQHEEKTTESAVCDVSAAKARNHLRSNCRRPRPLMRRHQPQTFRHTSYYPMTTDRHRLLAGTQL